MAEVDEPALEVDELVGVLGEEVASGKFVIACEGRGRCVMNVSRSSRWTCVYSRI
jgi:hypothetical protein